ncbi:MAG TPA: DUF3307 domain-containing protein [Thermoanaerobaculia bacterium]|nr:DUF3307 domain-containing protein [Thermoanaerobaculia bacterium]
MADLFVLALLGHLAGDYLLQTKRMALGKSRPGWSGALLCTAHVLIYTAAVCVMLSWTRPMAWLLVFAPHWVIDRWSLAGAWLKLIRGRTFESAYLSKEPYREFDIAFTSLVYTAVDNTFHLFCLWLVILFVPL